MHLTVRPQRCRLLTLIGKFGVSCGSGRYHYYIMLYIVLISAIYIYISMHSFVAYCFISKTYLKLIVNKLLAEC